MNSLLHAMCYEDTPILLPGPTRGGMTRVPHCTSITITIYCIT